jgi:predicted DNA-binding helix-hairpin-helix protein
MDTQKKLELLADASRFDLACACGTKNPADHRQRGKDGTWLYPVSLPRGGVSIMLKTLLSNVCVNDCRYCPFRSSQDPRRDTLAPEELARLFMDYARSREVRGLFLSSGVMRDPDYTMDRMAAVARILRRDYRYRGYIHLKVIPGASDAAIDEALSLASGVSLNIEVPTRSAFTRLSTTKDFDRDIIRPMKRISELTAAGTRHAKVRQTTQFIVGASDETDSEIVTATFRLYRRLRLRRVYFSAYQRGMGDPDLPGERRPPVRPGGLLSREHRLYQCDWLIRKYGFDAEEIPFGENGNLSLDSDPKEIWARQHPEFFPVDVNRADQHALLRVPGFGPLTVERILDVRKNGGRVRSMESIGRAGKRLDTAMGYVKFGN